jgi:cleavage stimulation factor subunit 3
MTEPESAKINALREECRSNQWNTDLWSRLIQMVILMNEPILVREVFTDFFGLYPTNVAMWIRWIEYEQKALDYIQLEKIFEKCLRSVPSVELCQLYMEYVHQVHSPENTPQDKLQDAQNTIVQAYEYVLSAVGTDKESGQLWINFIQFVQNANIGSTYEEQQKMDQLRRIFHRAIHTPLHNIEQIWKEYDTFENNLSKLTVYLY